jgi:hypothetical protein
LIFQDLALLTSQYILAFSAPNTCVGTLEDIRKGKTKDEVDEVI